MTDRARRTAFAACLLICLGVWLTCSTAGAVPAAPSAATQVDPAVDGEGLDATDTEGQALSRMSPGDEAHWYVDLIMNDPRVAEIALLLRAEGALAEVPSGPVVSVRTCSSPWVDDACAGRSTTLVTDHPVESLLDDMVPLGTFFMRQQVWIAITVRIPEDATAVQERSSARLVLEADPLRLLDDDEVPPGVTDGPTVPDDPGAQPDPDDLPATTAPESGGSDGSDGSDGSLRSVRLISPLERGSGAATAGVPGRLAFTGGDLAVLAVASLGSVLGGIALARLGSGRVRDSRDEAA